jgi:hypothetical protein
VAYKGRFRTQASSKMQYDESDQIYRKKSQQHHHKFFFQRRHDDTARHSDNVVRYRAQIPGRHVLGSERLCFSLYGFQAFGNKERNKKAPEFITLQKP